MVFALVERKQSPGERAFELMPGLYAAVEEDTVHRITALSRTTHVALHPSQGLWEELVRVSQLRANSI